MIDRTAVLSLSDIKRGTSQYILQTGDVSEPEKVQNWLLYSHPFLQSGLQNTIKPLILAVRAMKLFWCHKFWNFCLLLLDM